MFPDLFRPLPKYSILLMIVILVSGSAVAQPRSFPPIQHASQVSRRSLSLYATLEADTTRDLILGFSVGNNYSGFSIKLHVVYKANGRVLLFHSKKRRHGEEPSELKKEVLSRKESRDFRKLLWSTYESTGFKLYQDSLNSTALSAHPQISIDVSDGSDYFFSIRDPQGYSAYSSYEADSLAKQKVVGWQQRERFMEIWNGYFTKFKEYQDPPTEKATSGDQ